MSSRPSVLVAVSRGLIAAALSADDRAKQTQPKGISDITAACGVADIVDAHYRRVPKCWLSGMTLLDLDGDGDVNRDGHPDLICVEGRDVAVYLNDGRGEFTRVAAPIAGFADVRVRPNVLAWGGAVVTDFDNDGNADAAVVGRYFLYILRGRGDGTFAYANGDWGLPNTAWSAVDEGLCFGDVDSDGRLDLVTCATGPDGKRKGVGVFRNELPARHWLRVRLLGAKGNRSAAGAKIRVYAPGPDDRRSLLSCEQVRIWGRQSFHGYYAAARTERHFGLGGHARVDVSVEFHPSGKRVERRGVAADSTIEIAEQAAGGGS